MSQEMIQELEIDMELFRSAKKLLEKYIVVGKMTADCRRCLELGHSSYLVREQICRAAAAGTPRAGTLGRAGSGPSFTRSAPRGGTPVTCSFSALPLHSLYRPVDSGADTC